jgi:hypothetical protein
VNFSFVGQAISAMGGGAFPNASILLGILVFLAAAHSLHGQNPTVGQTAVAKVAPAAPTTRPNDAQSFLVKIRSKCQPDASNTRNVTWTIELENPTDKPIGDIVYQSTYLNQYGNVLGRGGGQTYSIRQVIEPRTQKVIEVKEGPIPERTANAEIQVVSAAFLPTDAAK